MLNHLRCQKWVVRLTIGLIGPWMLAGCSMWSGYSDRGQVAVSFSSAEMESFGSKLRHLNGDAESRYNLGLHYQRQGKHAWAIEAFEKTIAIDPHHARGYNAIGVSYDNLGNYAAAQKAYLRALEIEENMDCVWNNMGYSAMLKGNLEEAVAHYRKALALDENNRLYRNNLMRAKAQLPAGTLLAADDTSPAAADADKAAPPPSDNPQNAADSLDIRLTQAISSSTPPVQATIGKDERMGIFPEEHGKHANPSNAYHTSPASKGTRGTERSATIVREEPARPINASDVIAALAKLGNDFLQTIPKSSNDDAPVPKEKSRVVTVRIIEPHPNGFQFTVKPVLKTRAQQVKSKGVATVLSFDMPGAGLSDAPLMAANIHNQLRIPENFERKIADAKGAYIKVFNGNGVNGMARRVGWYLARRGFDVGHPANANHFSHRHTVLYYPPGYLQEARAVAKAIPGYQEMKESAAMPDRRARITLRIGRDVVPFQDMFNKG
jgi:tetratricopeptide (TPR) repeat protein